MTTQAFAFNLLRKIEVVYNLHVKYDCDFFVMLYASILWMLLEIELFNVKTVGIYRLKNVSLFLHLILSFLS